MLAWALVVAGLLGIGYLIASNKALRERAAYAEGQRDECQAEALETANAALMCSAQLAVQLENAERPLTPAQAAAVYLWAVGAGDREIPQDPDELAKVSRGLRRLVDIAGDQLGWETVDLGDAGDTPLNPFDEGRNRAAVGRYMRDTYGHPGQ